MKDNEKLETDVDNNGNSAVDNNEPTAEQKEQKRRQGIVEALERATSPENVKRLQWKEAMRFSSSARWRR